MPWHSQLNVCFTWIFIWILPRFNDWIRRRQWTKQRRSNLSIRYITDKINNKYEFGEERKKQWLKFDLTTDSADNGDPKKSSNIQSVIVVLKANDNKWNWN